MNDFSHLIVSHQIFLLFLASIFNLIYISILETVSDQPLSKLFIIFLFIFLLFLNLYKLFIAYLW